MADDNFRPFRSRDPLPREEADRAASDSSDPLAELARLIGQSEPYNEPRRSAAYSPAHSEEEVESSGQQWAAEEDYSEEHAEEERYDPPAAPSYAPPERGSANVPPPGDRYFSGSAAEFGGFREEAEADYHDEHVPALRARELPAYATAESNVDYAEEPENDEGETYADDHYYDEPPAPRRRGAVVVVMAVLGLAVIGSAGAFGYRAMFGGSMLPTLPPIIKASNGPNRIMPSYSEAQAGSNPGQISTASASPSENLVSREEQPVTIEPPKPAPRVVASIPIVGAQTAASAANAVAGSATAAPNAAPASPWPPPPMPTTTSAPTPAPAPAQTSTEPKRIHTVTIRPDQAGAPPDASAVPAPQAALPPRSARPAPVPKPTPPRPTPIASAPAPAGSNAPLSIVPGGQNEPAAAVARARATPAPMAVASAAPMAANMPAPSSGGGYAVQITSQRSEAEAQASFRELRAKFPSQLNGHEPIIRRADLGAKGTYYRALVGPFASAEQAAEMCSGLKAAGGTCLVQKN